MFSRTPVAKAFRVWVLDVLETLNAAQAAPVPALSTPDDRAPLRSLVNVWAHMAGTNHSFIWPQVKAHFQLSRIDDLPRAWIPDALAFVQAKIDALQNTQQLPTTHDSAVPKLPQANTRQAEEILTAILVLTEQAEKNIAYDCGSLTAHLKANALGEPISRLVCHQIEAAQAAIKTAALCLRTAKDMRAVNDRVSVLQGL